MKQEVKLEAEKPTKKSNTLLKYFSKIEPKPSDILEPGPSAKLESKPCVKTETEKPTVKIEPGASDILKPEPSPKTEADFREPEKEMESSDDATDHYSEDEDSDNPDNYHPTIILDPFDDGDPYREPTDVGHLVVNLGTAKKIDFEKDANGDFKCPERSCKYTGKKKDHLAKHYQIHGEKKYECRICAKKGFKA